MPEIAQNNSRSGGQGTGSNAGVAQGGQGGLGIDDQAKRGQEQFSKSCSGCHGEDLSGRDSAPALVGDAFMQQWQGRSVGDLFDRIRTTMPQSNPESLSPQAYLDIVAFLVRTNDVPLGKGTLTSNSDALERSMSK